MATSPIKKSRAPSGGKWNVWASVLNIAPGIQPGICCVDELGPRGHGGAVGYLSSPGSPVGVRCCERHGKGSDAVAKGLTWEKQVSCAL